MHLLIGAWCKHATSGWRKMIWTSLLSTELCSSHSQADTQKHNLQQLHSSEMSVTGWSCQTPSEQTTRSLWVGLAAMRVTFKLQKHVFCPHTDLDEGRWINIFLHPWGMSSPSYYRPEVWDQSRDAWKHHQMWAKKASLSTPAKRRVQRCLKSQWAMPTHLNLGLMCC